MKQILTRPYQGTEICETYNISPDNLYYTWESLVLAPNAVGSRLITPETPSALKTVIQSKLKRAADIREFKVEPGLRKARGPPASMLGLGSRMMKYTGVGLVETTPTTQPQLAGPRFIGKVGTSQVMFECHDMEGSSQDRRNCMFRSVSWVG
jgi:DNA polymerase alpha subunit B